MTLDGRPRALLTSYYDRTVIADPLKRLAAFADIVDINRGRCYTREEMLECVPGVHVTIAADEKYTAELLDHATDLVLIARDGTGFDSIDIAAATDRGILVTRAPVVHFCTANLVIGLMVALVRKIASGDRGVRENLWTERDRWLCPDLTGMTLGILGFGQVGREVAKRAAAMGMHIIVHDTADVSEPARQYGVRVAPLNEVLAKSDLVSVHIRHTAETADIVNAAFFARMKPGAYFVNTARGALVDENALFEALKSGHLAGAALDVFRHEPPEPENPLFSLQNVVCTPHVGGDTSTTMRQAVDMNVGQIADCFAGRRPGNLLNPEAWEGARLHGLRLKLET